MVQRKNRKVDKEVIETSGAYEAFKGFLADKGSKIPLKYIKRRFPKLYKGHKGKINLTFPEFFSSIWEEMEKSANEEEKYLTDLFIRFVEIDSSVESLKTIPVYLKRFPKLKSFSKAGITEGKYIIYHIENYLQETYILRERMKCFLKFLGKKFRKKGQTQISDSLNKCLEIFEEALGNITKIRGRHVHSIRYSDEDLYTLTIFDHVREKNQDLEFGYQLLLLSTKSKWLKWIEEKNRLLFSVIDIIFKLVNKCVFEQ
ncbi:MAG: hypothetical protein KAW52_05925 [candidate division Zixibacteria bacterium]|nr:hypothetical protein [candidate division Zixibacteria bacterium]